MMMITVIITVIIREVQARLEEETRARAAAQDNLIAADRSVKSALLSSPGLDLSVLTSDEPMPTRTRWRRRGPYWSRATGPGGTWSRS